MEWRKKRGVRGLMGHLSGYGCQIQFIKTEEELIVLACEIFGVKIDGSDAVDGQINLMKNSNRAACRRRAYANIERLWPVIEPFWVETQYLANQRSVSA